ncbi:MAG: hypothetical protein WAO56_01450 [Miniphocaeibacter sp.]|uniref:hypothetical protein n=1 Tax=Miniphocaeibacter sp. TaxID=3100973 RepID=UPI003BB0CD58
MNKNLTIDYSDPKPLFLPIIGEIYLIDKVSNYLNDEMTNNIILGIYIVFLILAILFHLRYVYKYFKIKKAES